jgi:xanthine dehydrogenase accessory factor
VLLGGAAAVLSKDGALLQRFENERTPLYLFGAGHVGRAVVLALAPLPFHVTWIDPRPGAFPAQAPLAGAMLMPADPGTALEEAPAGSFVVVMTHSHALDLEIVARALAAGRFPYVGLIGSATKRARFLGRLRALGLGEAAERLVCPIGVTTIRSKLPAVIAAGLAVDLLIRREQRATATVAPVGQSANG